MEIEGFTDYLIYSDGKVWSNKSNKFIKSRANLGGYKMLALWKDKQRKGKTIHRLIAEHYIPNPYNFKEVDHINRDKSDNRIENLRWVSRDINLCNQPCRKANKLGIKNICFIEKRNKYRYTKSLCGKSITKEFNTLQEAQNYKITCALHLLEKDLLQEA